MSNTFKQKNKNAAKKRVRQYREEIGCPDGPVCSVGEEELQQPELLKLIYEFWDQPGKRYGNNRKYWADKKWKRVKAERYKLNKQVDDGLKEMV